MPSQPECNHDLEYHPPKGTKWVWHPKALNYSPWNCDLSRQKEPGLDLWPLSILLHVCKSKGEWLWFARTVDFKHKRTTLTGSSDDPLKACLAAEEAGEHILAEFLPDWVRTALANKWRPPAQDW